MADPVIISDGGGGGGRTLETFLIIAVLAVVGWLLYTRVVKKPAPIKAEADPPPAKPPQIQDEGKIRIDSSVSALLDSMGGRRAACPPGTVAGFGKGVTKCTPAAGARPVVDISSSPLSLASAPATAVPVAPAAQALVLDRPAPVTAPVGVVISTQPAPPQSSVKPATTALSVAGRPSPVLIAPPPAPKPPPAPAVKPIVYTTTATAPPAKPPTPAFVQTTPIKPTLVLSSSIGKPKPAAGGGFTLR